MRTRKVRMGPSTCSRGRPPPQPCFWTWREAQPQSRLYEVTKSKKLRVCQFPLYYSISFRNPTTGQIEGIDADPRQGAGQGASRLRSRRSSSSASGTFIADLQANKCEIGMFGVGATLKRAQAVEFSKPYLVTNIYAVTRKDGKIKTWDDIDQKGVKAAVSLGSYIEVFMKTYLKNAELISIAPPNTREAELVAHASTATLSRVSAGVRT